MYFSQLQVHGFTMKRNLTINSQFSIPGQHASNHVSKWCKTGIIPNKPVINRRPASYLKRLFKRPSILVPLSCILNSAEKCGLSFTSILINTFPHIIWKLKGLVYLISFKTRPFHNIRAYICKYFPT